jgi:hypothetical protein
MGSPKRGGRGDAANLIAARDERVLCEAERAWSSGDRKPVQRSKERAGHGEWRVAKQDEISTLMNDIRLK